MDEERRCLPVGVGPQMLDHEADCAGRVSAAPVRREHVISDVHLVRGKPPAIVVAIVVHPAHHGAVYDDDVLRVGRCGSLANEATECGVASGDDERGIVRRRGTQFYHAVSEGRLSHRVSLSDPACTVEAEFSRPARRSGSWLLQGWERPS